MPLRPQRLHNRVRDWLATALALRAEAVRVAIHTPRMAILLDKRRTAIKRITALRAEKMSRMPLGTTRNHYLALNRRLAALAPRRETLVEIQVTVESWRLVDTILLFKLRHLFGRVPARQEFNILTALSRADAVAACSVFGRWLGVKGDAFQFFAALIAAEAFRVEAASAGADDAARDGQRTVGALGAGADGCWGPVRTG